MLVKSRCIVLHRFDYSDSSWIVKALTEESGVISFILKGGKRKDSPFKGALDPLALSEVVFRESPQKANGDNLKFVKEATILNWRGNMRNDLMSMAVAQVMAEIVMRYAPQGVPLMDEFTLLNDALEKLDTVSSASPASEGALSDSDTGSAAGSAANGAGSAANGAGSAANGSPVFARWLLDTCDLWGYHLDLGTCSRCQRELSEAAADFHPESGSLVCKHCQGEEAPRARALTLHALWNLHRSRPLAQGLQVAQAAQCSEFVENALLTYLRNHIGFIRELNSLKWLQEIRKLCLPQTT